mgnify:CR=1 FL=1|tara:strand:+ start:84 stop:446 length:363 start_codon:yes stop_codon:yes gene_type:complete
MKKDEEIPFVSLYEYLGRSTANNSEGLKVNEKALERGIKLRYKLLPEKLQTADYKSVATYPIDFLDSIYKRSETILVRQDQLQDILDRVRDLENKLDKLIAMEVKSKLQKIIEPNDDLPF